MRCRCLLSFLAFKVFQLFGNKRISFPCSFCNVKLRYVFELVKGSFVMYLTLADGQMNLSAQQGFGLFSGTMTQGIYAQESFSIYFQRQYPPFCPYML